MERKEFIKGACGICVALGSGFLMSAMLDSCKTPLNVIKTSAVNDVITIALTEFAQGDFKLVRVRNYNYDLAIQKMPDGAFLILVLECTHAHHPLTKTGPNYYCTLHGSQFDHSGKVTKGPADKNLKHLPSSVSGVNLVIQLPNVG